ncbi:MAG TPA: DsrE family protein [Egibacteraceae bacterium]|nr:DsrE family protein [Egibacteraceae bacterium]
MGRSMVVKVTHALDDPERAHIGCNVAAVALASGVDVHLFLAIEGVTLARDEVAGELEVPDAPPITDLLAALYAGGTVTVCTPCATRRGLAEADFRPGTRMAGSALFVELATAEGTQALVY